MAAPVGPAVPVAAGVADVGDGDGAVVVTVGAGADDTLGAGEAVIVVAVGAGVVGTRIMPGTWAEPPIVTSLAFSKFHTMCEARAEKTGFPIGFRGPLMRRGRC